MNYQISAIGKGLSPVTIKHAERWSTHQIAKFIELQEKKGRRDIEFRRVDFQCSQCKIEIDPDNGYYAIGGGLCLGCGAGLRGL
jgi:hypothetical protein